MRTIEEFKVFILFSLYFLGVALAFVASYNYIKDKNKNVISKTTLQYAFIILMSILSLIGLLIVSLLHFKKHEDDTLKPKGMIDDFDLIY